MSDKVIRASEIAEYVYCHRAWWLSRVAGYEPEDVEQLDAGTTYHQQHGNLVWRSKMTRSVAYLLVFMSVGLFVFLLIRALL